MNTKLSFSKVSAEVQHELFVFLTVVSLIFKENKTQQHTFINSQSMTLTN